MLHSPAGIQAEGKLEQVVVAEMDASWALNVRAHFVAAKTAISPLRKQGGGSVIITSSNSGVQYDREMIAYATTKYAGLAMTRPMAADYAKENIRFNSLCPGFIDTPFNRGFEVQMGGETSSKNTSVTSFQWAASALWKDRGRHRFSCLRPVLFYDRPCAGHRWRQVHLKKSTTEEKLK